MKTVVALATVFAALVVLACGVLLLWVSLAGMPSILAVTADLPLFQAVLLIGFWCLLVFFAAVTVVYVIYDTYQSLTDKDDGDF